MVLKAGGLNKDGWRADQFEARIHWLRQRPRDKLEFVFGANILGSGADRL